MLRAEAIPFILINEKKDNNNKVTYEFQLQRKAIDIFMAVKNKKVYLSQLRLLLPQLQDLRDQEKAFFPTDYLKE